MEYARRMRDDRGKGNIVVVEQGEEGAGDMGSDEFAVSFPCYSVMNCKLITFASVTSDVRRVPASG